MTTQTRNNPLVSSHSSDERTWATLAHASALLSLFSGAGGLIAAAVIWLTQKDKSAWVAFHGLQSLIFQAAVSIITVLVVGVVWVVGFVVSFATVGIGTIVAVPVMILVFFAWWEPVRSTACTGPTRSTRAGNSAISGSVTGSSGVLRGSKRNIAR